MRALVFIKNLFSLIVVQCYNRVNLPDVDFFFMLLGWMYFTYCTLMYHELSCFVLIHGKYKTQISQLLNNLCEHVKNTSRDNEFAMKEV